MIVRPVADDEWSVVAWLWQLFRHDLAVAVQGFPYADGRYQHARLDAHPREDGAGYLAWAPHPQTGEDAPVGFATVFGRGTPEARWSMEAFFVVPVARRGGTGTTLALDVLGRHPGAWQIAFQHANPAAGVFWRHVAERAWPGAWVETVEPVPDRPELPPDHWIRST